MAHIRLSTKDGKVQAPEVDGRVMDDVTEVVVRTSGRGDCTATFTIVATDLDLELDSTIPDHLAERWVSFHTKRDEPVGA